MKTIRGMSEICLLQIFQSVSTCKLRYFFNYPKRNDHVEKILLFERSHLLKNSTETHFGLFCISSVAPRVRYEHKIIKVFIHLQKNTNTIKCIESFIKFFGGIQPLGNITKRLVKFNISLIAVTHP